MLGSPQPTYPPLGWQPQIAKDYGNVPVQTYIAGTMTMTWELEPRADGTVLSVTAEDVPVGIRAEDHEPGLASSLSDLAAMVEATRRSYE
jgi:hypothetical protein